MFNLTLIKEERVDCVVISHVKYPRSNMMTIDSLTHITPNGRWFSTSFDASESRLLREMHDAGVDKSVVVALAGYIENDFVARVCARHPEQLIPGASINPLAYRKPEDAVNAFRTLQGTNTFALLKLHPRLNKYDPLSSKCLTFLEGVAACHSPLPIWLDTLFQYPGASLSQSPVNTVRELVHRFPSLIFVLLHACGTDILQLGRSIEDCSNAFIDISFTVRRGRGRPAESDFMEAVRLFSARMVFGSDFPEISFLEAEEDFNSRNLDLTIEDRASMLGGCLQQILAL
jgi:predicted TIM-barrel fold metal-dependent hydrolase